LLKQRSLIHSVRPRHDQQTFTEPRETPLPANAVSAQHFLRTACTYGQLVGKLPGQMLDKHAFLCYTLRARKMQKEETGMEAHHRKVYLADLIARLYERLVREEQFLWFSRVRFQQ
jgi:hypothetical protein